MRSWRTESVRASCWFCCVRRFDMFLGELESMLKDQNPPAGNKSSQSSLSPTSATQSVSSSLPTYPGLASTTITAPSSFHAPNLVLPQEYQSSSVDFGVTPSPKGFMSLVDTHQEAVKPPITPVVSDFQTDGAPFLPHGFGYDLIWPAWPRDLPSPNLVRHL